MHLISFISLYFTPNKPNYLLPNKGALSVYWWPLKRGATNKPSKRRSIGLKGDNGFIAINQDHTDIYTNRVDIVEQICRPVIMPANVNRQRRAHSMATWGAVRPRVKALQDDGFAIYEDRTRWHLAFALSGYLHGGDAVLLFAKEVNADELPVIISLGKLEKLVAQAAQKEKA